MRSWKLFTILGLFAVGTLTWGAWFFVTSGNSNSPHLARLTSQIQSIHWIELEVDKEYRTSATEDIDAFVAALNAATQSIEPVKPGQAIDLAVWHSLRLAYLDGREREIVIIETDYWFYIGLNPSEFIKFHGDALAAFIRRMESASEGSSDE